MKTGFTLFGIMLFTTLFAQQNYRSPRGVDYDAARQRYLVANNTNSTLLSVVPGNAPVVFASGVFNCKGVVVVGDTVYVCSSGNTLKAYNLSTGLQAFSSPISSTDFTGICTDWAGNLFITDFGSKKIIKYNIETQVFSYFFSLGNAVPTGIVCDTANQRMVITTYGNGASLLGLTLTNPVLSTLKSTTISNFTGIAMDARRNYYVTTMSSNTAGVFLFDSALLNAPIRIVEYPLNSQPRDIYYNVLNDTLAVVSNAPDTLQFFKLPIPNTSPDYAAILVGDTQTICVLQNDMIDDSANFYLQSISAPNFGTAAVSNNCIDYTGTSTGRDTITYVLCVYAGIVPYCNTGTLYITVLDGPGNHAPIGEDNRATAVQRIPISVNVGIDDVDLDGDSLCITELIGAPLSSIDSFNCNTIIYMADSFIAGHDTCYYVVCDNGSPVMCDTASLIVTVHPNPAFRPVANFVVDTANSVSCGIFIVINTSVGDTGVAFWRFYIGESLFGFVKSGDTAFYGRPYPWDFYGQVC